MKTKVISIYDDNLNIKNHNSDIKRIYKIIETKYQEEIEYWKIKSIFDKESIGWIMAKGNFKVLNTIPQKLLINQLVAENDILLSLEDFNTSKLYTKRLMMVYNENIYYGLFDKEDFIGLINAESLDFGFIKPVNFTFKNEVTQIYSQPDLKYPTNLNNYNKTFTATGYFNLTDERSIGINFGDKTFWTNADNLNINFNSIQKNNTLNKKYIIKDYFINTIRANNEEYYNVNNFFETTKKIEGIINKFTTQNSESKLYKAFNVNIGIICDEFMYYAMKDSANIEYIPFTEDIKINGDFDLVLVVSSWRGIDESWQYLANPKGTKRQVLNNLLDRYNETGIPTVFYSKEDPVNYERFVSIAEHCKYIYTSAEEMIEVYKKDTGNDNVDYLQFSINPKYHNPIGKDFSNETNHNQVIFAGSWMKKYPTRNSETKDIFDGVIESKKSLNIIDRNFNRLLYDYQFPYQFTPYISQTIDHENLMKLHKATSWGINLNSVKYSSTMFANRIYELQAMGNLIISNYSMGVNNKFPYISMVHNKEDVLRTINATTEKEKYEVIAKSISEVMLNHTAYHRINKILQHQEFKSNLYEPKILVIGSSEQSKKFFEHQFYPYKDFIFEYELKYNNKISNYDFITYFSEDYIYEENYLGNILSGFAYTDADVIEMNRNNIYNFKETIEFDKYTSLIDAKTYSNITKVFQIPLTEIECLGMKDKENVEEKILSVIIPIHNNGKYLEDKCFRSLKRSSIFDKMEIIMIDDGSTNEETLKIIQRIIRRHPDIVYHRFDEGSGSASRPRNKGIDMVRTKYLTFLDPDNEASGDGYKFLIDELQANESLDLVLGNVIKEDNTKKSLLNYHYYVVTNNEGNDVVSNTKEFLIEANLRAHSIQALVVKSNILQDNNLKMVEGAAGQDTMFFQEIVLHANNFKSIPYVIHIYYAAVEGSVTTTIKKSFFEKYLVLEKERVPFLKKHDLYEIYVNQRFPYYFVNWYYKRLSDVPEDECDYVIKILHEILSMYIDAYDLKDERFNRILHDTFDMNYIRSEL